MIFSKECVVCENDNLGINLGFTILFECWVWVNLYHLHSRANITKKMEEKTLWTNSLKKQFVLWYKSKLQTI